MAQHDMVLDNANGATFRADANNALAALVSQNSGTTAPSTTYANQIWYDTTNNLVKMRNEANDAWITLKELDQTGNLPIYYAKDIKGSSTNDNALTGFIGQIISSNIPFGSAVSLTSGVAANVTSISLTAGDWDVSGYLGFLTAGTTVVTYVGGSISVTSATFEGPSDTAARFDNNATYATGSDPSITLPIIRKSLSGTTTVYLVASSTFTTSTNAAFGFIRARRVR